MKKLLKHIAVRFLKNRVGYSHLPVFLLHGVIPGPGPLYQPPFDNIEPELLRRQLMFLKQHYDFVPLSEAVSAGGDLTGKCALTFDDGYECLKTHAFPVLEDLNIPATVFVISSLTQSGAVFWRDQIHFLIKTGRDKAFHAFYEEKNGPLVDKAPLKHWSKNPNGPASYKIQTALNHFFEAENLHLPFSDQTGTAKPYLQLDDIKSAPPLIEFGNHTASHPVMPTLGYDEQLHEITACQAVLQTTGRDVPLFALPFGAYNTDTLKAAAAAGYNAVLYHENTFRNDTGALSTGAVDRASLPRDEDELAWRLLRA